MYRITKIFIFLFILNLANPCDSSPCKNGASCQSVNGKFSCECAEGFEGDTCEEKGTIKTKYSLKFKNMIVIELLKYWFSFLSL